MHAWLLGLIVALTPVADSTVKIDSVLGKGAEAKNGDLVTVLYKGWLQDGTVFDQTKDKGPFGFRLGKGDVIKGWDVGVRGMKVGGKRILQVPASEAYGDEGAEPVIPKRATLIFEVELLRVDAAGRKPMIEIVELAEGSGEPATEGDTVDVHYKGTFLDGTKFDSSYDRQQTFPVKIGTTKLIQGFTMGLLGMKQGGKRKVTIPYDLAYGEEGRPPVIPPRSTLVFELEIVKITK